MDHLFVFCGDGVIKDFTGSYSEYRAYIKDYEAGQKALAKAEKSSEKKNPASAGKGNLRQGQDSGTLPARKNKPSYKEQRELEQLEKDLESLAAEKAALEESISSGTLPYDKLQQASERIGEIITINRPVCSTKII